MERHQRKTHGNPEKETDGNGERQSEPYREDRDMEK